MLFNFFRRLFGNSQNRKVGGTAYFRRLELLGLEQRINPVTITVSSNADSGAGTLRQAIIDANTTAGDDIINFSITGTITLDSLSNTVNASLPTIISASTPITGGTAGTLTITGPGSSSLTISGLDGGNPNRNFNIFNIAAGGNLSISGVTVSGAKTAGNGGAFYNAGTLTVSNCTLSGNTAGGVGGGILNLFSNLTVSNSTISGNTAQGGGGIYSTPSVTLIVNNSTISGNSATTTGGGITNGGDAIFTNSTISGNFATNSGGGIQASSGTLTVSNSTFSGNSTSGSGGGIFSQAPTLTVSNSTFSGNSANQNGGGISNFGTINIANTIIANSVAGGDYGGGGTVNLISPSTAANNIITLGSFPLWATTVSVLNLSSLTNNGGPTETIALTSLTPASVTAGGNASISNNPIYANGLDQRSVTRSTTAPSIGAFEYITPAPSAASISPSAGSTAGGTIITITGTDFTGATAVTIGGNAATSFTVDNATTITATTPAGTAGTASVLVTTAAGTNAANSLFTYAPTVTLNTNSLAINATTLTITGTGFATTPANNTVTFNNGAVGNVASATATQLTVDVTTPPTTTGNLTAVVTTNGASSGNPVQVATVVAGPATKLISTTFALGSASGSAFTTQPVITIQDSGGNTVTNYSGSVTMTVSAGATIVGNNTATVTNGVATFTDVGLSGLVGNYNLTFTSGSLATATQTNLPLTAGAATQATLTTPAAGSASGSAFTTQPVITIQDSGGNTITNYSGSVTITVSAGATIVGNDTATVTNGVATFSGVGISGTANTAYTLTFTSGSFTATQSITPLGAANTPTFGTTTSTADGFTVLITNYDSNFTYIGTATANGSVSIDSVTHLVTVTRVSANTTSTATINTTRTNYVSGSAQVTATSNATPTPTPTAPLITGTPPPSTNGSSTVNLYNAATGQPTGTAVPFPGFNGPVKVVSGDFNNDGVADIIAGAGFGGGPAIAILDSQTGQVMESFFAFDQAFTGGVFVAVQDVNGDGIFDIIASAGPGGGPEVRIFDGRNLNMLRAFYAYDQAFTGGVSVASIDFNNDGILDLVTGAGPGGAPHVKVYDGATNAIISQWYAYPVTFTGGVFVAAGDIGNDGNIEVVTGAGPTGAPVVAVWDPYTGALLSQFMAYAESFTGGVRVGVNDGNGDGISDIVTGAGPGGGPQVNVFSFPALDLLFSFYSGEQSNTGGVFVS